MTVMGDRVRFIGSGAWSGEGVVEDGAWLPNGAAGHVACSTVEWDGNAPAELQGWLPNEMLETVE